MGFCGYSKTDWVRLEKRGGMMNYLLEKMGNKFPHKVKLTTLTHFRGSEKHEVFAEHFVFTIKTLRHCNGALGGGVGYKTINSRSPSGKWDSEVPTDPTLWVWFGRGTEEYLKKEFREGRWTRTA